MVRKKSGDIRRDILDRSQIARERLEEDDKLKKLPSDSLGVRAMYGGVGQNIKQPLSIDERQRLEKDINRRKRLEEMYARQAGGSMNNGYDATGLPVRLQERLNPKTGKIKTVNGMMWYNTRAAQLYYQDKDYIESKDGWDSIKHVEGLPKSMKDKRLSFLRNKFKEVVRSDGRKMYTGSRDELKPASEYEHNWQQEGQPRNKERLPSILSELAERGDKRSFNACLDYFVLEPRGIVDSKYYSSETNRNGDRSAVAVRNWFWDMARSKHESFYGALDSLIRSVQPVSGEPETREYRRIGSREGEGERDMSYDFNNALGFKNPEYRSRKSVVDEYEKVTKKDYDTGREKGVKERVGMTMAVAGLGASIFFIGSNFTGNVIGSLSVDTTNLLGVGAFLVGIVGAMLCFKRNK